MSLTQDNYGSESGILMDQVIVEKKGTGEAKLPIPPPILPLESDQPRASVRKEVFALDEGDVVLTFPENLSSSSFDDLEGYLGLFLKKARRRAGVPGRKKSFLIDGRSFEVRAVPLADRWQVRVFEGETPVSVALNVEYATLAAKPELDLVGSLMETAQRDVERMVQHKTTN